MRDEPDSTVVTLLKLLGLILVLAILPVASVWNGFVFAQLWNWFAQPYFHVALSWAQAAGGLIVWNFLRARYTKDYDNEKPNQGLNAVVWVFTYPLFAWGAGAIIHQFV